VLGAVDLQRLLHRGRDAPAEAERDALVDVLADDHELVAAEPRDGVGGAHGGGEPARERDEHRVAGGVAVEVVDALEVVDVDVEHRGVGARPLGVRERVLEPVAAERAVGEPRERVVQRLVPYPLLGAQARVGGGEHVGDRDQERPLLLGRRRAVGGDRAEHLVAGPDRDAPAALDDDRRLPSHRRHRAGLGVVRLFAGAPRGERHRLPARARGGLDDQHVLGAQRHPDALGGLARQVRGRDAAQRALPERRDRRLLVRLPAQPPLGLQPLRDVAADGEQHRPLLVVDDAPAHLADELGPVAAQAVRPRGEAQRVLELEVELRVALVALAHPLGPQHGDRAADQLGLGVAEQLLREHVDEHDRAVAPRADDRVWEPLEQPPHRCLTSLAHIDHSAGAEDQTTGAAISSPVPAPPGPATASRAAAA
jgi:hypothetical protein